MWIHSLFVYNKWLRSKMASLPVSDMQQAVEEKNQQQHRSLQVQIADNAIGFSQTKLLVAWYGSDGVVIKLFTALYFINLLK